MPTKMALALVRHNRATAAMHPERLKYAQQRVSRRSILCNKIYYVNLRAARQVVYTYCCIVYHPRLGAVIVIYVQRC